MWNFPKKSRPPFFFPLASLLPQHFHLPPHIQKHCIYYPVAQIHLPLLFRKSLRVWEQPSLKEQIGERSFPLEGRQSLRTEHPWKATAAAAAVVAGGGEPAHPTVSAGPPPQLQVRAPLLLLSYSATHSLKSSSLELWLLIIWKLLIAGKSPSWIIPIIDHYSAAHHSSSHIYSAAHK